MRRVICTSTYDWNWDGVFKSWAVAKGPSVDPAVRCASPSRWKTIPSTMADFEGAIPKGQYGGGTVQLWDRGYWTPEGVKTPDDGLKTGDLKFTLDGKRLQCSWVLVRLKADRFGGKHVNWLLIKHRDAAAKPDEAQALLDLDRSVASGRSMAPDSQGQRQTAHPVHAGQ